MTIIKFRNVIVWPVIPRLTRGVKLHDQRGGGSPDNVTVLPVVHVTRKTIDKPRLTKAQYNDIQKIVLKTMRGQRYTKRSGQAAKKLRSVFINKA
jgi:hypothetical protein